MSGRPASAVLGEFVAETSAADVPDDVVAHATLCLLDTLGCGLFGSTLPQAAIARDVLVEGAGEHVGPAGVWGARAALSAPDAALANGTAVHAFELDDLHPRSILHPGSVVTSAVAAAAALRPDVSGRAFLAATVLGYEVGARVGSSVGAAHLLAGWHPTGTHGTIAAAAGTSAVLGLDAAAVQNAIGIAGSQSAGLMAAQFESMVKRFHAGRAAQSGVYAALLARHGYIGIKDLFEAEYGGYLSTFSTRSDPALLTADLGSTWETLAVGFKPYSTNGSCHPSIDALRALWQDEGVRRQDVDRVDIRVSTATVKHVGWPYVPDTVTTAQMNLPYIVAVVLTDGEAFAPQFTEARISDPDLVAFARRVHVVADPAIDAAGDTARHRTRLTVTMRDGRTFSAERDHAHGSASDPMSVDEVRTKFRRLAGTVLSEDDVARLEDAVDGLRDAPSVRPLLDLIGGPSWR